jgi:hypothetical protein
MLGRRVYRRCARTVVCLVSIVKLVRHLVREHVPVELLDRAGVELHVRSLACFLFMVRTLVRRRTASPVGNLKMEERLEEVSPLAGREVYELVRLGDLAELREPDVEEVRFSIETDHGELRGVHRGMSLRGFIITPGIFDQGTETSHTKERGHTGLGRALD